MKTKIEELEELIRQSVIKAEHFKEASKEHPGDIYLEEMVHYWESYTATLEHIKESLE